MARSGNSRRLSLKWRALALTSLVLLGLALLITWNSNRSLTEQFQHSRQMMHERQQQEIELAMQRSADALKQLASVVAASGNLGSALQADDAVSADRVLAPQWPTLQLDAGIDDVTVFDASGERLAHHGQLQAGGTVMPDRAWIRATMQNERPRTVLLCRQECRQYAAVPVLGEGSNVGVVMVSRSLADVTRYIQLSTGSEIALLVEQHGGAPGAARFLADWQTSLLAVTHERKVLPVLQAACQELDPVAHWQQPKRLAFRGRHYELTAVPLEDRAVDGAVPNSTHFLLISDITDQLVRINRTTGMVLLIALAGWLTAEMLLLCILWQPMARLRQLSRILPRLARGEFSMVRRHISPPARWFHDEIDVLAGTARDLTDQLETLEGEVQSRGQQLELRVRELAFERDFVSGLLDTAQVLIVTHDRHDRITLVNRYCCMMTGLAEDQLLGRGFTEVMMPELRQGERLFEHGGQQEGVMYAADGQPRTIVWYHTPLGAHGRGEPEMISVGLDITERKLAEQRLTWLAHRDPLTELYNRRFFEDAMSRAVVHGAHGAVLYLDLDRFKEVNELGGHQAGDQLLRLVARAIMEEVGQGGIIARLGGDEFAVLLEEADGDRACRMAETLALALDQIVLTVEERHHRAMASIGIALYPLHGESPNQLMANADFAMYKAKEDGAQRWHLLSTVQPDRDELQERVYWVERLRSALIEDRFELMLQPIVKLADGSIQHYETLVRLREDNGELIAPASFIPVAERSGQIVALDRWVLSHALQLLSRLAGEGVSLALNLSGQSLHDAGLKDFLAGELERSGADPRRLIIEVTETAAVTDFATARGVLEGIRALGCGIALDDFGVGFSSFHYLGQLPADYIKIDGSFIRSLPESEENRLIVRAIADIARGFGKRTIAEFVDREALLPILTSYGIDYVQGYYLGRPERAARILDGRFESGQ
ncbi:PAS domain S-box-containing protein/diguanylate cyclase (GGDEF)-like protein [Kushneria sinocarnis]|uniref:PAS domain S-box-containing protein/diguanylate cyclase (GGDEF)-like protein n=1 Tax=Kushneria sinocarnis TaxID=595502 RepID=A0A420WXE1_9GAMM|nr:EAL domain-containing protein [Kushneria sinocarnis]RKR04390.1 PAS domain S-box-containing protein/diguanylate cyclase (GGDEF)-like protein [Kushneria sinocarnis]